MKGSFEGDFRLANEEAESLMKMAFSAAFQEAICSVSNSSACSFTRPGSSQPRLATRVFNNQHAITSTFIHLNTRRPARSPNKKSLPSTHFHRTLGQCRAGLSMAGNGRGGLARVPLCAWGQSRPSLAPLTLGRSSGVGRVTVPSPLLGPVQALLAWLGLAYSVIPSPCPLLTC